MGPDGAGHYVKMVHNGIEYGDIQLISKLIDPLKIFWRCRLGAADVFAEWNTGELDSYLIQITSEIFRKIDPDTGRPLVDMILDKAGQRERHLDTPICHQAICRHFNINAAVEAVLFLRERRNGSRSEDSSTTEGSESLR